ncbi:MAG: hypothetical protein AB1418_10325, partial [Pseudomonadota bacterium]
QVQRAADFDPVRQAAEAALTGQFNFAANLKHQGHAAPRIGPAGDSTEQLALRKFTNQTRERRNVRPAFPGLSVTAEAPWIDLNWLKHAAPDQRGSGAAHTGST